MKGKMEARGISRVTQKLISKNGMVLWIPQHMTDTPRAALNWTDVDIHTETTNKLFPLGSRLEFGQGWLLRYGYFGATSTSAPLARMMHNHNYIGGHSEEADVDMFEGDALTAIVAGDKYVDLETAKTYAKDYFEDGLLVAFSGGDTFFQQYRICGNDLGNGTYCRVYIDREGGFKALISATEGVSAYRSLYSDLRQGGDAYTSVAGLPLCATVTAGSYGWVLRRGRVYITPTAYFGDSANERMAQVNYADGTSALKAADATQTIGYLTEHTFSGYGDSVIWLALE